MVSSVNSSPTMTGLFNKKPVKYPQIVPRNVYLANGRYEDPKKVHRAIENFNEPFWVRVKNWFKYKLEDMISE